MEGGPYARPQPKRDNPGRPRPAKLSDFQTRNKEERNMKKRLLSAALALAMVLTLLPVSAFAASTTLEDTPPDGTQIRYEAQNVESMGIDNAPGWYYNAKLPTETKDKWTKVKTAGINGVAVGNLYYQNTVPKDTTTNFTVISGTVNFTPAATVTSLNVDLQGGDLSVTNANTLTSVTVNDSKCTGAPTHTITLNGLSACTRLNLTNVKCGAAITMQGTTTSGTTTTAKSNDVTLTNVNMSNYGITLGGTGTNNTYATQTLTASRVTMTGTITVNSSGGTIHLTDVTGKPAITYTGYGTAQSIWVDGQSDIGNITLNAENDTTKASQGIPGVKVDGGNVAAISLGNNDVRTGTWSVEVNQQGTTTDITMGTGANCQANVKVNKGHTGKITVSGGQVSLTGPKATAGDLDLSGTTTLNVSGGSVTTGTIDANNSATVTLNIPADNTNYFTKVENYHGGTIKGGTFGNPVDADAMVRTGSEGLYYQLSASSKYTYYRKNQLADALSAQNNSSSTLTVVGQKASAGVTVPKVTFKNNNRTWGVLEALADTNIILPSKFGSDDISGWFDGTHTTTAADGFNYNVPNGDVTLDAKGGAATGKATKLTSVKAAANDVNSHVGVTLSGNVITATGAVEVSNGTAKIPIDLTTDAYENDGYTPVKLRVNLLYDEATGKLTFANEEPKKIDKTGNTTNNNCGVTVKAGFAALLMSDSKTEYTLNGSGLRVTPSLLQVDLGKSPYDTYSHIEATINVPTLKTDAQKETLRNALTARKDSSNNDNANFNWHYDSKGINSSQAILRAVNAVQAGISNTQIQNWIKDARREAWNAKNRGTYTDAKGLETGYGVGDNQVWLVPYLQINVTDYNPDGSLTATLVPSYRVEILYDANADTSDNDIYQNVFVGKAGKAGYNGAYVAKSGTLGSLTGDVSGAYLKLNKATLFPNASGATFYTHQDKTYVYPWDNNDRVNITHAGSSGLGSVEINTAAPMVTRTENGGTTPSGYYDKLQAAVDDTKHKDEIKVEAGYTGSTAISVTGDAREFKIVAYGDNAITSTSGTDLVKVTKTGDDSGNGFNHAKTYQIQLLRDTKPEAPKANVIVASAVGGSARVSKTTAAVGDVITITLAPSTGYTSGGVSVKTKTGANVSVTGSGSSYKFTYPTGAESVTVTPSFTKVNTQQKATVTVSNNTAQGTAVTTAGNSQVAAGTPVTVSVIPNSGFRTMGVSVSNSTATRTGVNTFSFNVPSGVSNVTVTPRFDRDNGTVFEDVWSTDYYSSPVAWAVKQGITNGDGGTYTFNPSAGCTRAQMVTFLWRAAGYPTVSGVANPFWDVQPGSYYYNAVLWAVSKGITNGVESTRFGVNEPVTRAQAVTFLYRFNNSPAASASSGFYDVPTAEYYAKAVTWAKNQGITNGDGSSVAFNPIGTCSRAQIVTFLYRDINNVRA